MLNGLILMHLELDVTYGLIYDFCNEHEVTSLDK